jgi:hypothetical protein
MTLLTRLFLLIWVSPNSLVGLLIGIPGLLTGGKVQLHRGCLEFSGGVIGWMLGRLPPGGVLAMTLGHTIVGQSESGLAVARDHEQVHVRQYERWGPLFIPAYLSCSVLLWIQNRDYYRENPFEIEAYAVSDPTQPLIGGDD